MAVEAGEVEIWESVADHGSRSSVGVIVKTSNYCALPARAAHFADRAKMIARVKIWARAADLSLWVDEQSHGIPVIPKFAFFHSAPDKLPRRGDSTSSFLNSLDDAA